jgi:hypothetical protein
MSKSNCASVSAHLACREFSDKEHSTSIYRQFKKITARNILYLQSELRELELRQEEFDRDDAAGDLDAIKAAMDWQEFCDRARDPDDERAKEAVDVPNM